MLLRREVEGTRLADPAEFDIRAFVRSVWHVRPGQVRKHREHPVEPLAQRALGLLRRRDFLLEDLHLGDQIGCIFAAFLRRTNRLGSFVAEMLNLLELRLRGAPPSIQLRSEAHSVGTTCVSTCRSRWSRYH